MFRKKKREDELDATATGVAIPQQVSSSRSDNSQTTPETFEDSVTRRFGKPLRSALSPGTVIQGKLSFDTPVIIEGKLGGEVYSTDTLIVGKLGRIDAQVRAKNMIIAGTVTGPVELSGFLEIAAGGKFEGDFSAASFVIKDGGIFNGNCRMTTKSAPKVAETAPEKNAASISSPTVVAQTNMSPEDLKQAVDHAKRNAAEKIPEKDKNSKPTNGSTAAHSAIPQ